MLFLICLGVGSFGHEEAFDDATTYGQ